MLKSKMRATAQAKVSRAKPAKSKKTKPVQLTPEQQARLDAFRAMTAQWEKEWNALSPEQQREEHEGWKRAMNRMNEDRRSSGQRLLFSEPIE